MQNNWLVSKLTTFLVKGISKQDINPFSANVPFKQTRQFVSSKMCEKAPVEE